MRSTTSSVSAQGTGNDAVNREIQHGNTARGGETAKSRSELDRLQARFEQNQMLHRQGQAVIEAGKTVELINRAIRMEGTRSQELARKLRNKGQFSNEAAVGELYAQMLRDGGDMAFILEGSEVDNSRSGEYNGKRSYFGLADNSHTKDAHAEQETVLFSGAVSGAYNDRNDPDSSKRNEHAARYYQELRNSNKDVFIMAVAKHANLDANVVSKAYKHIFEDKHHLEGGYIYFEPDYDMAETFRRLRTNDQIQKHDIILLYHEALEYDLMQENPHMTYDEAHEIAQQRYNYKAALMEWLRKRGE